MESVFRSPMIREAAAPRAVRLLPRRYARSAGERQAIHAVVRRLATPPMTTATPAPSHWPTTPASNSPS